MIDNKLKSMYDDLYGTNSDKTADIDTEAIHKTLDEIFGSGSPSPTDESVPSEETDARNPGSDAGAPASSEEDDSMSGSRSEGVPENHTQAEETADTEKEEEEETDPMEELDALIGLEAIKHDVKELVAYARVQKLRSDSGLKSAPVSLHLVFTGNPGTGKTTVARLISRLYKQIGVLSRGQLVEVDRSGLVAGYVGQTALKTQEKINEAMGGILFIDEAYALAKEGNDFGQEAIDTILKAMEDNRDDFVVIVAGYTEPMQVFIESNPGLKSRFNKYIEFADYTMEELTAIFKMYCGKYEYEIDDENLERVTMLLRIKKTEAVENFANAREARNLFEKIITNQARRINDMENPTVDDMRTIIYEDLYDEDTNPANSPEPLPEPAKSESKEE